MIEEKDSHVERIALAGVVCGMARRNLGRAGMAHRDLAAVLLASAAVVVVGSDFAELDPEDDE